MIRLIVGPLLSKHVTSHCAKLNVLAIKYSKPTKHNIKKIQAKDKKKINECAMHKSKKNAKLHHFPLDTVSNEMADSKVMHTQRGIITLSCLA